MPTRGRRALWAALLAVGLLLVPVAETSGFNAVVSLGEELTAPQKAAMLDYFGLRARRVRQLLVSRAEAHQVLDGIAPASEIGLGAVSSAYVVPAHVGTGVRVTVHNLVGVTVGMYRNALVTAGMQNVLVRLSAPYPIPGAAGLVGALWAYHGATGRPVNLRQERVAARELVVTSQVSRSTGHPAKVVALMTAVKERVVAAHFTTGAQIRPVVIRTASRLHVHLTPAEAAQVVGALRRVAGLPLTVNQLRTQLTGFRTASSQAGGIWSRLMAFLHWVWARLASIRLSRPS